jgi:hypothetical protein
MHSIKIPEPVKTLARRLVLIEYTAIPINAAPKNAYVPVIICRFFMLFNNYIQFTIVLSIASFSHAVVC